MGKKKTSSTNTRKRDSEASFEKVEPHPQKLRTASLVISKKEVIDLFGGQGTLVQRMLEATRCGDHWFTIVANATGKGGRTMIDRESAEKAYERIKNGETPPLMRSERQRKAPTTKKVQLDKDGIANKQGHALTEALKLLPKGAEQVVFRPNDKSFSVNWADGEFQWFRVYAERGKKRRLREISFNPPGDRKNKPPAKDPYDNDDWVEDELDE